MTGLRVDSPVIRGLCFLYTTPLPMITQKLHCFLTTVSLLFLAIILASCTTSVSYEKALDTLGQSNITYNSFEQIRYDELSVSKPARFMLEESSDAFNFQTGKSFYKAFRLPEMDLPYVIKVTSYGLGSSLDNTHIFYPKIVLLDDNYKLVKQTDSEDFLLRHAGMNETSGMNVKLEGYLLMDNPYAKYFIVFTTQELMDSESMYIWVNPLSITPYQAAVVPIDPTLMMPMPIKHSPFGSIRVEVSPVRQ